jgi:DUF177 domain-containing protein
MSGGASKLRDFRKLAETRAELELDLALAQLPGMTPELSAGDGHVHAKVRFGREQGFAVADVELNARLEAVCQRCMGPMPLLVQARSPVLLVESEREAEGAPAGWETFLAPEGRLDPAALVAEELLLAVPIVPLHGPDSACAATAGSEGAVEVQPASAAEAAATRPFADLRALLERADKPAK